MIELHITHEVQIPQASAEAATAQEAKTGQKKPCPSLPGGSPPGFAQRLQGSLEYPLGPLYQER